MTYHCQYLFRVIIALNFSLLIYSLSIAGPFIDPLLTEKLANIDEPVEVIVTFAGEGAPTDAHISILRSAGITAGVTLHSLPIAGVLATAEQVDALAQNDEVLSLYYNAEVKLENNDATHLTGVRRLRADHNIHSLNNGFPVSGRNIGIVINDSGIDGLHPDVEFGRNLVQNVQGATNLNAIDDILPVTYIEDQPNTDLGSGHGTHVAATAAGTGRASNGVQEGAAPGANLIGYGSGLVLLILDTLTGFDYAITHQFEHNIRVISNSWGSPGDVRSDFNPHHPISFATYRAYQRNIIVVFSAGNSGPSMDTITGNYKKAPWVITVGATDKDGELAGFSSRGDFFRSGTFTLDGVTWSWEDRPTVSAPGVSIISANASTGVLGTPTSNPLYASASGTSMAAPLVAGIAALILEANPSLSVLDVKRIIQETATNIPSRADWEVGAGLVNAYAAVHKAFEMSLEYGKFVNALRSFNSNAEFSETTEDFTVQYDPTGLTSTQHTFHIPEGLRALVANAGVHGLLDQTGNPVAVVLTAPDGTEYSSGIATLFTFARDRSVTVINPMPGEWNVEIRGIRGVIVAGITVLLPLQAGIPENVEGELRFIHIDKFDGLRDIKGHPAEDAIILAVLDRLVDGNKSGNFSPNRHLRRIELGEYAMMGQAVRQFFPTDGSQTFSDVSGDEALIAESVTNRGASFRDRFHQQRGVILPEDPNTFGRKKKVARYQFAYSLVQSWGLEEVAKALEDDPVTVEFNGERIPIDDQDEIPEGFRGYVQLALELRMMHAFFSLEQDPFGLEPVITAEFKPLQNVSRAEFAVSTLRAQGVDHEAIAALGGSDGESDLITDVPEDSKMPYTFTLEQNYPNPFNPVTNISYTIPEEMHVTLNIYNMLGQKVKTLVDDRHSAGRYTVSFDAQNLPSGLYIYRINAGPHSAIQTMSLIK